jgi:hypothetical protein
MQICIQGSDLPGRTCDAGGSFPGYDKIRGVLNDDFTRRQQLRGDFIAAESGALRR